MGREGAAATVPPRRWRGTASASSSLDLGTTGHLHAGSAATASVSTSKEVLHQIYMGGRGLRCGSAMRRERGRGAYLVMRRIDDSSWGHSCLRRRHRPALHVSCAIERWRGWPQPCLRCWRRRCASRRTASRRAACWTASPVPVPAPSRTPGAPPLALEGGEDEAWRRKRVGGRGRE